MAQNKKDKTSDAAIATVRLIGRKTLSHAPLTGLSLAVLFFVACGQSNSSTPFKAARVGSGSDLVAKAFKSYSPDQDLSASLLGATVDRHPTANPNETDLVMNVLLKDPKTGNSFPVSGGRLAVKAGVPTSLQLMSNCSNDKYEIDVYCKAGGKNCDNLTARLVFRPNATDPLLIDLDQSSAASSKAAAAGATTASAPATAAAATTMAAATSSAAGSYRQAGMIFAPEAQRTALANAKAANAAATLAAKSDATSDDGSTSVAAAAVANTAAAKAAAVRAANRAAIQAALKTPVDPTSSLVLLFTPNGTKAQFKEALAQTTPAAGTLATAAVPTDGSTDVTVTGLAGAVGSSKTLRCEASLDQLSSTTPLDPGGAPASADPSAVPAAAANPAAPAGDSTLTLEPTSASGAAAPVAPAAAPASADAPAADASGTLALTPTAGGDGAKAR